LRAFSCWIWKLLSVGMGLLQLLVVLVQQLSLLGLCRPVILVEPKLWVLGALDEQVHTIAL
jgi:hypothetical protein